MINFLTLLIIELMRTGSNSKTSFGIENTVNEDGDEDFKENNETEKKTGDRRKEITEVYIYMYIRIYVYI
jgi:hypothetical protein